MMKRVLLTALLCLAASAAQATVLVPIDFEGLVTGARSIVHGRVVDVRSHAGTDRDAIYTLVTLEVEEHLKGDLGPRVTFRVPGGQVGRYRSVIVGAPEFQSGDEVVVFLSARGPSFPYLFGLSQGVYRVSRGTGAPLVTPPPVMTRGVGAERVVRGDPVRRPMPVQEFARLVRDVLERAR